MTISKKMVEENTIYLCISGSRAYGTHNESSDHDYRGICIIPDKSYYFGIGINRFEQMDKGWKDDRIIYDLRKALLLMADCNPNMIDLLFMPQILWVTSTPFWQKIYKERHKFLSKKAKHTYSGYAYAQFKKIKLHDNPSETTKKEIQDYGSNLKHAMHLVRLLRMCEEILRGEEVHVVRSKDAEELKAIRNGAWTLKELQQYTAETDIQLNELYKTSSLPEKSDKIFIDKLCQEIIEEYINGHR